MARTLYSKMARNPIIFVTSLFRTLCAIKLIKTSVHADDLKLPLSSQGEFSLCAMKDLKLRSFWGRAAKQAEPSQCSASYRCIQKKKEMSNFVAFLLDVNTLCNQYLDFFFL